MELQTVPIDISAASTVAVFTPEAGKYFAVYYLMATNPNIAFANTIVLKSGSTDLSGAFVMPAHVFTYPAMKFFFENGGFPILVGRAAGEAFNITMAGAGWIGGYAVVDSVDL